MITEDQVVAMFAKANPVPSLDLLDPVEPLDPGHLEDRSERSRGMTELKTTEEHETAPRRPRWLVPALAAVVIAVAIGMFMTSRGPQIVATPVDKATAFWVAVADGDRETATSYLDPTAAESGEANTYGRAQTLEGQFEWYEAVGFEWALDECIETDQGNVECTVAGSNDWSDALGQDPVPGTYLMGFGDGGITAIVDKDDSFANRWLQLVFEPFSIWVTANHPADAMTMWSESDVNPEILELFRINTARFVQAHTEG